MDQGNALTPEVPALAAAELTCRGFDIGYSAVAKAQDRYRLVRQVSRTLMTIKLPSNRRRETFVFCAWRGLNPGETSACFHRLTGNQAGRYSVRVTGNWRVTFGWDKDEATDVDLEDYH